MALKQNAHTNYQCNAAVQQQLEQIQALCNALDLVQRKIEKQVMAPGAICPVLERPTKPLYRPDAILPDLHTVLRCFCSETRQEQVNLAASYQFYTGCFCFCHL